MIYYFNSVMCSYFLAIVNFQNNILTFCSLLYCSHRHKMLLDSFGKIESCILLFLNTKRLTIQRAQNPSSHTELSTWKVCSNLNKKPSPVSMHETIPLCKCIQMLTIAIFFRSLTVPQSNQTPNNSQVKRFNECPLNYTTALC